MRSDQAYLFGPKSSPGQDALTWHAVESSRVWLHSRVVDGTRRVLAVEVELVSDPTAAVSEVEKKARADIAAKRANPPHLPAGLSTWLRQVPMGQLGSDHAELVALTVADLTAERRIRAVREPNDRLSRPRGATELDSSKPDSLAVAVLYSEAVAGGQLQPANRLAKALGVEVELVHRCLRVARRNGWLTSAGPGVAGGELTETGRQAASSKAGKSRVATLMRIMVS